MLQEKWGVPGCCTGWVAAAGGGAVVLQLRREDRIQRHLSQRWRQKINVKGSSRDHQPWLERGEGLG